MRSNLLEPMGKSRFFQLIGNFEGLPSILLYINFRVGAEVRQEDMAKVQARTDMTHVSGGGMRAPESSARAPQIAALTRAKGCPRHERLRRRPRGQLPRALHSRVRRLCSI